METLFHIHPRTPLLNTHSVEEKRREIKNYFIQTYELYETLFEVIKEEKSFFTKPEPLRHPLIFYFGHTATFFVNKLIISKNITKRINPHFESIFAIGVDEMSWDDLDEKNYDWPPVSQVRAYRENVKILVSDFIDQMDLTLPIQKEDPSWIILMGIEHERIHLETSSVIIRQLPIEEVKPHPLFPICSHTSQEFPENHFLSVKENEVELGKKDPTYGWDSEYGFEKVKVPDFSVTQMLASQGEYLEFVSEGGYESSEYWTLEGKKWLESTKVKAPRFWFLKDNTYFLRTLTHEIPLPLNWPVEVNYYEAKAFCSWKSKKEKRPFRLMTEAEWQLLRETQVEGDVPHWEKIPGNIHLAYYASSCPVNQFKQGDFFDVVGNVWQWTETPINAFEGFQVHPAYDDFSVPTFDGDHLMIKGGSWISTGNEALKSARYAFRRHFYQHAGFRYVKGELEIKPFERKNMYETDEQVSQYLEFHYGEEYWGTPNFPKACVEQLLSHTPDLKFEKALDLGCAVGRSTFELAKKFETVIGIDFTARFIEKAVQIKKEGLLRYAISTEGELLDYKEVNLKKLEFESLKNKVEFWQGDACNLKSQFKDFDLIFCGNLIDRLYDPSLFLNEISKRVNPGGYLVLTSPYTWLEEFTEKEKWVGGYKKDGENLETLEGLKIALKDEFQFIHHLDIPFVIRETRRKFQHTLSEMSIWQKK